MNSLNASESSFLDSWEIASEENVLNLNLLNIINLKRYVVMLEMDTRNGFATLQLFSTSLWSMQIV